MAINQKGVSSVDIWAPSPTFWCALSGFIIMAVWMGALILNALGMFGRLAGACYSIALLVVLLETIHLFWVTFRVAQDELSLQAIQRVPPIGIGLEWPGRLPDKCLATALRR